MIIKQIMRKIYIVVVLIVVLLSTTKASNLMFTPPRIIEQPPNDGIIPFQVPQGSGEEFKPLVLECEAEAHKDTNLKYRWTKNGKHFDWNANGDDRITQKPGRGTIVINIPKDEDDGQYQCFAENDLGIATSNSVFVKKSEFNAFKDKSIETIVAKEGEPFSLQCQAPDGWPKLKVYWITLKSDGSIKSINNSRITLDPEGTLWFSNVTRIDASNDFFYACAATSVFRKEYKIGNQFILDVKENGISSAQNNHEPVRQYVTAEDAIALRGEKFEMYCIYGGTPLPQTVWMKNGQPIHWSDRISQGHYGKSIVLKNVTSEDAGSYTCDVSNGVGNAQSYSINLQVFSTPYFKVEPEIQHVYENETVEFSCEASGNPEPSIQWMHNGKAISETPPNTRRIVQKNRIIIKDLVKGDTGNYGCNATNSLGYVYKDFYINVVKD